MSDHMTGNVPRDALLSAFAAYVAVRGMSGATSGGLRQLLREADDPTDHDTALRGLRGELLPSHPFYSLDRAAAWVRATGTAAALIITPHTARVALLDSANPDDLTLHAIPPDMIAHVIGLMPAPGPAPVAPVWDSGRGVAAQLTSHLLPKGWHRAPEPNPMATGPSLISSAYGERVQRARRRQ
jgi:hypothetical protein